MQNSPLNLILAAFLCLPIPLGKAGGLLAAPAENSEIWTLEDLVKKTLEFHPELRAMRSEVAAEKARIGPAGSLDDPMVSLEAMNLPADSLRLDQTEMSGLQLAVSQRLPFPGKLGAQRDIASFRSRALESKVKQKEFDTIREVKRLYYDLYLRHQKIKIRENQRIFLQQMLATSRSQYILNQLPQAALLNLQVEEASLINEKLRLSSETKELEAELAHMIGHAEHLPQPSFKPLRVTRLNLGQWTEEKLTNAVATHNAEIQGLQSEVEAEGAALILAKKSYLPDFELMASYTLRQPVTAMDPPSKGEDLVGARIGISIPIWGTSKQSEQIKEALAQKEKAQYLLENARLMQIHQVRALLAELKESDQRINLFESGLLQLTKQAVESGRLTYLTGKTDYGTLLNALKMQQDTEYSYQEALVAYEIQRATLEALLGQSIGSLQHEE